MRDKKRAGQKVYGRRKLLLALIVVILGCAFQPVFANDPGQEVQETYIGSLACKGCHPEEYDNFMTYAKKSISFQSVEKQMRHLTSNEIKQCYPCHTTGYGRPGGFLSVEETPHLKNAGCEVCHGPGGVHSRTGDPVDIISRMSKKDCEVCHISERVKAFKYKPLIHGGAH